MARCENQSYGKSGSFSRVGILSRIKAYSVAEQRSPKHTPTGNAVRGFIKGVTYLKLCYRLYSELPDFADFKRFFLNTPSVTERKDEKWTTTQRE